MNGLYPGEEELKEDYPVLQVIEHQLKEGEFKLPGDLFPEKFDLDYKSEGTYNMTTMGLINKKGDPQAVDADKSYMT